MKLDTTLTGCARSDRQPLMRVTLARDGEKMVTPMPQGVTIRPSYRRLCIVNTLDLIPFAIGLLVIGFPVAEFLSHPSSVVGLLLIFSFWVFGASAMGLLMFTVTVSEEGIGQVFPSKFLRWDEMRSLRSMFPFPLYIASAGFFSRARVCFPRPWLAAEPAEFFSAIEQCAPEDHVIRRRVLSRLAASG